MERRETKEELRRANALLFVTFVLSFSLSLSRSLSLALPLSLVKKRRGRRREIETKEEL